MRLITWNCKGAFHRKHDFVAMLKPSILIVPECEHINEIAQPLGCDSIRTVKWFGDNPRKGLAVISYGDYQLELHPSFDSKHHWIVPLVVSGPVKFTLIAVWTLPLGDVSGRYVRPLFEAFETYKTLISTSEVIWAGDFNANFNFDKPARKHKFRNFVKLLEQHGLRSAYHKLHECEHGKELDKTFYLYHHADKGYHIDYVFTSEKFHPHGYEVSIGTHGDWSKRSDHTPLICDFFESSVERLGVKRLQINQP